MSYFKANEPPGVPSQWRQSSIWNIDIIIIIFCRFQEQLPCGNYACILFRGYNVIVF